MYHFFFNAKSRVLCIIFLILIVVGCGRSPQDVLTVTMSLGEEEWAVFRDQIFPLFEQKHRITIHAHQIEADRLATKLEALQASEKQTIDVFAQDNMSLAALINKNLVLDLSKYEKNISPEVLPNLIDSCKFNDRLYFMPFRPNVQIIYYNAKVFGKYGIRPPHSWQELLEVARTLKEKEGLGRILLKGFGGNPTATQVYEFVIQAGGDPYAFNDQGCIAAFEFLRSLAPYLSPETARAKWDTVNHILAQQEAYFAINWPFGVVILIKDYGLKFIHTYPGLRGPVGRRHVIGGDVFGIPKNSGHKDWALKFIVFMQSREVQEILVSRLGWPSIRNDAYGQVEEWQQPHFNNVQRALENGVFRGNITWWPLYKKYVNLAFKDIVMNQAPVKATLDKYKTLLEKDKEHFLKDP